MKKKLSDSVNELRQAVQQTAQPARGLGDVVAKATQAVGLKPCQSCKKRQEWLNKKVPFGPK